jgi:Na+-translocating ferredoxin:NAD+ oxidoreductase RnfD subunit
MAAVAIRGASYPIVLPKLRDPRLHLAVTITSLQVLGQVAFEFRISIAQILLCLVTCAVIEITLVARKQHALMWPASALLTGNGVAFILRVPGTQHGDWWSLRGWWIFVATAGGALLSKYVLQWRGHHFFNPSNIGLVVCFLALGRARAEPLAFWWGPMSWWMLLALAIIVTGGFAILSRLSLLRVALTFWAAFALAVGVLAIRGHAMTARWHLGPITGVHFWWVLVTSPEVLVFLFFMITDPKTAPTSPRARVVYAATLGVLAAALIAPTTTEYAAKVALLSSLAIVCLGMAALRFVPVRAGRRRLAAVTALGVASFAAVVAFGSAGAPAQTAAPVAPGTLPPITILPSPGVQTQLDRATAEQIAYAVVRSQGASEAGGLRIHLVPGTDQSPPTAVAQAGAATYRLRQTGAGAWALAGHAGTRPASARAVTASLPGVRLVDVAPSAGLAFKQGSFRFGPSNDTRAMMGGGVCWLDYDGDGRLDLFAVNSYSSADAPQWESHGGLPTSHLFQNRDGRYRDVTRQTHAGIAAQGDGCVAADLNGDGRADLVLTTTSGVDVLWNDGGRFRTQALPASGWRTGATVADVNGDGRPDIFVAGYADPNEPAATSFAGFPTNVAGVRDLLFLNEGDHAFREAGVAAGLEAAAFRHALGAEFMDVNGDGRPDLYVANDEDPNELYVNVPWPGGASADPAGLGFRFEERAVAAGVADPFAGMGIAAANGRLVVTNSRREPSAAYRLTAPGRFANDRPNVVGALGTAFAGWGASWVDLRNSGRPDLVVTTGGIPVVSLAQDAQAVRVLAPSRGRALGLAATSLKLNGRGLAVADAGNDGREQIAINTIGGNLVLLRPKGPSGHWLDVAVTPFSPGAVVTAVLPGGRSVSAEVHAGSSYLSSEDPRVHFGLGPATHVAKVHVRFPSGATTTLANVRADRVVTVTAPAVATVPPTPAHSARLDSCTPATHRRSVARIWNDAAVASLRLGHAPDMVQARDLYDLAEAVRRAYVQSGSAADRDAAISYGAYRLLLWQASYGANIERTFALLTKQLQALCYSPSFVARAGAGAGLGNRVARDAIRTGRHDGANEEIHFADPTYTPRNQPLILAQPGSPVHDATFWQPLALSQVSPRGSGAVPAQVQSFTGSQWGSVRTFAGKVAVPPPALGDPSGRAYRKAALGALHALSGLHPVDASPAGWNAGLPSRGLAGDVALDLELNAALNDAAVSAYAAKRAYETPRPVSMIRYLAFNGRLAGVGDRWAPPAPTPASPGYPSADAAYAAAARAVLGPASAARAARVARQGVAQGVELAADAAAGTRLGAAVGRRVVARLR